MKEASEWKEYFIFYMLIILGIERQWEDWVKPSKKIAGHAHDTHTILDDVISMLLSSSFPDLQIMLESQVTAVVCL